MNNQKNTMVTMKDLAQAAGVSLGTVSNVLNGKSGVSLAKIEKVQRAIEQLGYLRNGQAAQLKKRESNKIAIILPNITDIKYNAVYESLYLDLHTEQFTLELYLTFNQEEKEKEIIEKLKKDNYLFIVTDSCLKEASEYGALIDKCLFIFRGIQGANELISFDYHPIIDDIIEHLIAIQCRHLYFIKENTAGWREYDYHYLMTQMEIHQISLTFIEQQYNIHQLAFQIAQSEPITDLFVPSFEHAKVIHHAFYFSDKTPPKIYTFYRNNFNDDQRFICYGLDYGYLAKELSAKISGMENHLKPNHFGFLSHQSHPMQLKKLTLLAIQNPSIDALKMLLPHFEKLTGISVDVKIHSFAAIPDELAKNKFTHEYDLVRIDMESLPFFAKDYLEPLNTLNEKQLQKDFSEILIAKFCRFNRMLYAVPFDPSIQLLFYRKDLFEDPKIKRLYYETYKQPLCLPENFEQFNHLLTFFKQPFFHSLGIKEGSALIIDDTATLATEFLVRYYALMPSIFANGKIAFQPSAVKIVLQQLKILYAQAVCLTQSWWRDEVTLFEQGLIPMVIVYMNHFSPLSAYHSNYPVGFTSVPNGYPLLGGGSLAVLKHSTQKSAAEQFIRWFLQHTVQEQYVQLGGMSVQNSLIGNQSVIQSLPWLELARQTDFCGIRENTLMEQAVNLREIEAVVGRAVKDYLQYQLDEETILQKILQEIATLTDIFR